MIKMVAMPIYGKNLLKIFFGTNWLMSLKLDIQHWALEYYQICSNDSRLTFDLIRQRVVNFGSLCIGMGWIT